MQVDAQKELQPHSLPPNSLNPVTPPRYTRKKELLQQVATPMRISGIQFGIASAEEIASASHIEVNNHLFYDANDRSQTRGGTLDPRLGAISKRDTCETCKEELQNCIGHSGYIRLSLPVFHVGYFKATLKTLQMICKYCSRVLLAPAMRRRFVDLLRNPTLSSKSHIKGAVLKEIWEKGRKVKDCFFCGRRNGTVKKTAILKIVHYPADNKPPSKKKDDDDEDQLPDEEDALSLVNPAFTTAVKANPDLRRHITKAADDLHPLRVLQLFEKVPSEDVQLLDMDPALGRPERMLIQYLPVPPLCIRPSVCSDPAAGSTEDDLTVQASSIVRYNAVISQMLEKGAAPSNLYESWDVLQYEIARYINSEQPGLPMQGTGKPLRGVSQRLKGKTGRFRGNLSGKRVDFSGRTVISPDPNLRIDQVGVPIYIAKILTYRERATPFNLTALRKLIMNGTDVYPGANFIEFPDGSKKYLKYGDRAKLAADLRPGTIVERHLHDDDIVLFNRQPSLHRISIMAHRVKISPHRTFRFNECVCAPYNADFDGDEMNLHVPQTEEARAEAMELMGVVRNILTPKNGEPLVAATQDFITSSYLVTAKSYFMDRAEFSRTIAMMSSAEAGFEMPPPAIIKPVELWTGKQLFTCLVQTAAKKAWCSGDTGSLPHATVTSAISFLTTEVAEKGHQKSAGFYGPLWHQVMSQKDTFVCFRNGELHCGQLGKKTLGDGSKKSILYVLSRECGNDAAAFMMNCLARFSARWHSDGGFSIGVDDVTPSANLKKIKHELISQGYATCSEYMEQLRLGTLEAKAGCTPDETLETELNSELSSIRTKAGDECLLDLDVATNAALIMSLAGSKGSPVNISQMVACVGQQTVGGGRAPDGFFGRALPHFELGLESRSPLAKGFVSNSFFSGLTATEFFMHAQSGREGLTDTAVKTAETGYMQRRLVKALEDLNLQYDSTVRASNGSLVQFSYGDDGLDPMQMETDDGTPVNFSRMLDSVQCASRAIDDPPMDATELSYCVNRLMEDFQSDLRAAKLLPDENVDNKGGLAYALTTAGDFLRSKLIETQASWCSNGLRTSHIKELLRQVLTRVQRCNVEPGTAVGAVSAQSIGEPGTQMTLKTFHFAGVASMNVTQGVPRLKEIINASKTISTPITTCALDCNDEEMSARIVKGRVESTTLGEIATYMKEVYRRGDAYLAIRLDLEAIRKLALDIDIFKVAEKILRHSFSKLKVTVDDIVLLRPDRLRVRPFVKENNATRRAADITARHRNKEARKKEMEGRPHFVMQSLKEQLQKVSVCGIPSVSRAVISRNKSKKFELLTESDNIGQIMVVPGIKGTEARCNHIMAVEQTFGIEGARYVFQSLRFVSHEIIAMVSISLTEHPSVPT